MVRETVSPSSTYSAGTDVSLKISASDGLPAPKKALRKEAMRPETCHQREPASHYTRTRTRTHDTANGQCHEVAHAIEL